MTYQSAANSRNVKTLRNFSGIKIIMNAIRIAALVVLAGLGVYFSLVVPALTMNVNGLAFGIVFLLAAVVLLVVILRGRRRGSPSADRS
ncbi:MAG TPA: hypothetical protein VGC18_00770 [Lacisediminihabitans sp.]|uniref:hypothetical protein n=1 Tax=Lacisediminihabitans sp. TaxID=2787631 RepID=UPI002EDAFC0B